MTYIAMAGLHGYLPNYSEAYDTYEAAVEDLVDMNELEQADMETLRNTGYLELELHIHGNEYCEITKAVE